MSGNAATPDADLIASQLGLSEEQRQAIGLSESTVIAAGAGAGKTTTLVGALLYDLLVAEIDPARICVCTFTRAAAANLGMRVESALGKLPGRRIDLSAIEIGTIDAICNRVLTAHSFAVGVSPGFAIGTDIELRELQRRALLGALEELDERKRHTLDQVIDLNGDRINSLVIRAYDQLRLQGRSVSRSWPSADPDPKPAIAALQELRDDPKLTSAKQIEAIDLDIEAIASGSLAAISTNKWGIGSKALTEARDRAVAARDRYRQSLIDLRAEPVRELFGELLDDYGARLEVEKQRAGLLDFLDLAKLTLDLVKIEPCPISGFDRTYIDEAQDTSPLQREILTALSRGPVISVGDAAQSIYSFRGADVDAFRAASTSQDRLELADNYRSRPELLAVINELCAPLPGLKDELIRMRSAGPMTALGPRADDDPAVDLLTLVASGPRAPKAAAEAAAAVPEILAAQARRGLRLADVCVLVRTNDEVSAYAEAFRAVGVPALAVRKRGLLSRPECLDLVAYLRLLADPADERALLRVLSSPFCGLSDQRLDEICAPRRAEGAGETDISLFECVAAGEPALCAEIEKVRALVGDLSASDLLRKAIETHGFDLALNLIDQTGSLWRNVEKLLRIITAIERDETGLSLRRICARLEVERDNGIEGPDGRLPEEVDAVRVMTVHHAKGDEFKLVVAARLSYQLTSDRDPLIVDADGRIGVALPATSKSDGSYKDSVCVEWREREQQRSEAEQWRLLYVALTRAREQLLIVGSGYEKKDGDLVWRDPFAALIDPNELPERPGTVKLQSLGAKPGPIGRLGLRRLAPASAAAKIPAGAVLETASATIEDLVAVDMAMPEICGGAISYSALTSWRRCSLRRRLELELDMAELEPLPDPVDESAGDRNPKLVVAGTSRREFGVEIHRALAKIDWKDLSAIEVAERDAKSQLVDELLAAVRLPGGKREADRAAQMIERLLASPLAGKLGSAAEAHAERGFSFRLGPHLIVGKIDLIATGIGAGSAAGQESAEALIVDWKSGSDPDDVFGNDYGLQRRLYAAAVFSQADPPAAVRTLSFDLNSGETVEERWDLSGWPDLRGELEAEIEAILTAKASPATSIYEPFCEGCPGLSRICPVAGSLISGGD